MSAAAQAAPDPGATTRFARFRDAFRPPPWLPYLLRVSAAAVLALYLAFVLELPTPYSAVTTVYIVANPVRGAIISKSVWRIVGTVVGAIVAVAQTAVLGQAPLLFDAFIALWMGICCALSTLLRFFPSYGAVLAGYTVVIVDAGVFANPETALATALYRLSVVVLGIVVCGLVFLLTQGGPDRAAFERDTAALLLQVASLLRQALGGPPSEALLNERRLLAQRIAALEQSIVYAGADDIDVRHRAAALRLAGTRLLGALSSGFHAARRIREREDVLAVVDGALAEVTGCAAGHRAEARARLDNAMAELERRRGVAGSLDMLAAIEQARDTLERLAHAIDVLDETGPASRPPRLGAFLDWYSAVRNGMRGALTVLLASLAWYLTRAPAGPTLLAYLVPAAALLSTNPSPGLASVRFAQGTILATFVGFAVEAFALPRVEGFPLVALVLLAAAAPGIVFQIHPVWSGAAFSYLVFLNTQLAVQNPQVFDLPGYLNTAEMYLIGPAALLLTFRILLPPDPAAAARNLARSLALAAARVSRRSLLPDPLTWENVQLQKILRYGQRLDQMGTPRRSQLMAEAAAGLILGRIVLQLRGLARGGALSGTARQAVAGGLRQLQRLRDKPARRAAVLERQAAAAMPAPSTAQDDAARGTQADHRAAALLHEAARLLEEHAVFFDRDTTTARIAAA